MRWFKPFGIVFLPVSPMGWLATLLPVRLMTGLFTGGLAFAGILAFFPGRLMWELFFA